jgi:hypothetical protein
MCLPCSPTAYFVAYYGAAHADEPIDHLTFSHPDECITLPTIQWLRSRGYEAWRYSFTFRTAHHAAEKPVYCL